MSSFHVMPGLGPGIQGHTGTERVGSGIAGLEPGA